MSALVTLISRSQLRETFDLVLAQWPDVIEPGEKTFHIGGGCNMRGLNDLHGFVEDWLAEENLPQAVDQIVSSVEHYVFTNIHSALQNLTSVRKSELDFEAFVSRFDGHPNYKVISDAQD